jgi:hypothetical protein
MSGESSHKGNQMKTIPSLGINSKPSFACVTNSKRWGFGVFSWHLSLKDAEHNARVTGGTAVPVDYVDGELITPSLATKAIDRWFGR